MTSSNLTVSTGGVLNVIGGSAGYQIGGAATTGNYLRGNGTSFVSSAIQAGDLPVCSGTCNYISNQTGVQASSNFNISANGTIGGILAVTGVTNLTTDLNINTNKFQVTGSNGNTLIAGTSTHTGLGTFNGGLTVNTATASDISITSGASAPTADQLNITNAGSSGVITALVNGLSINYKGGAAAVEAAAERIDLQPGTTSGGTWNGFRLVPNATGAVAGVTENGLKIDNLTTPGAGTENAINIGTGWDNLIQAANFNVAQNGTATIGTNTSLSTTTLTIGGTAVCTSAGCTSSGGLAKNAQDTSSFAVPAAGNLYVFTNSSPANASGVLKLDNGTNTNSALTVTASGNTTAGQALVFASNTNAAPSGNLLDLQSGSAPTSKFSVSAAGNVSLGGTSPVTIQSTAANGQLNLTANGTGLLNLDTSGPGTVTIASNAVNLNLATTATATAIGLGNTTAGTTTLINGGTGGSAISLQAGTSGTISVGTTNVNTVTVGSVANTGTLTFGQSTAGETINIGNGNVATTKTNTINIGATATSTGKDVITIGSLIAASTTAIQGGTGASALALSAGSGGTISVGSSGVANTIQVGNTTGAVTQTINIGNNTTAASATTVVLGSKIGTSPVTIQSGTSGVTVAGASSTTAFNVQNAAGSAAVLNIDNNLQVTSLRAGTDAGVLGAEMMTGSESFTAGSGWTTNGLTGTSATITHTNSGGVTPISPTPALSILNTTGYNVTYTISGTPTAGSTLTVTMGGQTIASYTFDGTTDSNFTDTVAVFTSGTANLAFTPSTDFIGTIASISVKQITGNNNPALVVKNASGATNIEVRASTNTGNTFIGIQSGLYNVTGNFNTALGDFTLQSDTSGNNNTAVGNNALQSNVSGSHNVALGLNALTSNTSGSYNTSVGENSLGNNTVGANNTALGNAALENNTIGLLNTAVGNTALQSNTTGWRNTGIGNYSMINNTTGAQNSALGSSSLLDNTTGNQNDAPGDSVLASNTTGSDNSGLGYSADVLTGALQNATVIGANAQVGASNNIILGYSQANGINDTVGIGTSFAPDALTVSPQTYGTNGSVGSATTIEQDNGTHTCPANSGTAIIGAGGTAFTSGMNGATIYYSDGTSDTVFYNSATSLTAAHSKCVAAGSTYNIVWGGLHVHASSGSTSVESVTNSTTAFSVNDNLDNQILAVDSVNQTVGIGPVASGTTAKLLVTTGAYDNLVVNQTSTNNLLRLQNSGTDVVTVTGTGSTIFRNSANSTTAFQIQSSLGTNEVLNADTTNTRVGIGTNAPDATLSVKTPSQNAVINFFGTSASTDYGSIQVGGTGDINNTGNRSLWLQPNNGSVGIGSPAIIPVPEAKLQVVGANAGALFPFNILATDNTAFAQGVGGGIGFSGFIDNTGSDFAFGSIQGVKENATSGNDAGALHFLTRPNGGNLAQVLGLSSTGATTFKNSTNSTTAFQVQNFAGTPLLAVDTTTVAPIVSVGVTGATALASTANVATSTGAAQTINIGAVGSGVANSGTTVSIQGGTGASAISIGTSAAVNQVAIGSNNGASTVSIQGGSGGSTINDTSGALTLSTTTSGTLSVTSAGALTLTGAANSTWDLGAAHTLSLQTTNNGPITTGTGLLTQGGSVTFSGTTARVITGPTTGGLTINDTGGALALSTTTSGTLSVTSAAILTLTGAAASTWDIGNNLLSLQTTGNGAITTGTGLLTQGGNITFSGTTARTITGPTTGGLTINDTGGALNLTTTTSGALTITAAASSIWSTSVGTLTVESASGSAFTASAQGTGNSALGTLGTGTTTLGATGLANVNILGPVATTSTKGVQIGTVDGSQTNLILDNANTFADVASSCSNSVNLGAMYYNDINPSSAAASSTGSIRVCEGIANTGTSATAAWSDLPSTADLGAIIFGVVPDSGNSTNAQDLPALITAGKSGPCKVSAASATTVNIEPCVAYTGGRRIVVNQQTAFAVTVTSGWTGICLDGTNDAPNNHNAAAENNAVPGTFSTTAPVLCIAQVAVNGTTITQVYDTRTFTTTTKEFVTATSTVLRLGMLVAVNGSGVTPLGTGTVGTVGSIRGVVVGTTGSLGSTTPNSIIATAGPAFAKVTDAGATAGQFLENSAGTSGYGTTSATGSAAIYGNVGFARNTTVATATCAATPNAANCIGSTYVLLDIR